MTKKICIVGHYGVGKTSLVRRFVEKVFGDRYLTTVGLNIYKKELTVGEGPLTLTIWDLAGEDDLAPVKLSNLKGTSGYILVVDGCRASTWATAVDLQQRITDMYGPLPFVLAVNKLDRVNEWEVQRSDVAAQGWTTFETSAKAGTCVEEMFLELSTKMLREDPEE